MFNIGYAYYIIVLLIITGVWILTFDVTSYKKTYQTKEKKIATFLAWMNIILGSTLFVFWWSYEKWLW